MRHLFIASSAVLLHALSAVHAFADVPSRFIELPADVLGNLNGLPHEFKYINHPGKVEHFTPSLPNGGVTDDDTDIEWVYLREIARTGNNSLPPANIAALWKRHINRRIFAANR